MNTSAVPAADLSPRERKRDLAQSLHACTAEALVAMPIVTMSLPVNVFMSALLAKGFDFSKAWIGVITALPFICNFLQIAVTPFLERWHPPKTLTVACAGGQMLTWLALCIGLPWIPRTDSSVAGPWIATWFFAVSFFGAIAGVTWNAWIQEWVPQRLRGKYFGFRNRLTQVSTLVFSLATGWSLARWEYGVAVFQVVIAAAVVLRCFSLHWQWHSPTHALARRRAPQLAFFDQVKLVRGSRSLLAFVAFGAVWQFATNCFGPFQPVFLFEELAMSAFDYSVLATLAALGGALSLPAWGRLLDQHGNKAVMAVSLALWQLGNFTFCLLTPDRVSWTYPLWLWGGVTSAGFVLGQFTMLLKLIPREARNLAIGLNLAVTSLFAAVAPITGGAILTWALARWPERALTVYHVTFLVQPMIALAGCFILLRVREPAASSLSSVVGAMRNLRTISGVFGLSFLVNHVFVKPVRRPPR